MKRVDKSGKYYISNKGIIVNSVLIVVFALVAVLIYILPSKLLSRDAIDYYSEHIFPKVALPFNAFSNFFMQSLTETFAVIGSIMLLILIIIFIVQAIIYLVKGGARGFFRYFLTRIRIVMTIALIASIIFQLMIGLNYNRTPVAARLKLDGKGYTCDQYLVVLDWAYNEMIAARRELGTDYNGVAHMSTGFEQTVYDANAIIMGMDDYYELGLSPTYVRAKPVALSYFWSYTYISGFYDAMLGEANLNVDYMDVLYFPVTVCHEIIHAKGYSREYDANTAAVLTCVESSRADFRYAGFYYIFMNLYGVTRDYAIHEGIEFPDYTSRPEFQFVMKDISASNMYDESLKNNPFTKFIEDLSEDVNDTYLKSNGQKGGTDTYEVPSNIYVDFYYKYILEAANAEG